VLRQMPSSEVVDMAEYLAAWHGRRSRLGGIVQDALCAILGFHVWACVTIDEKNRNRRSRRQ
jgi:hypothetical protein